MAWRLQGWTLIHRRAAGILSSCQSFASPSDSEFVSRKRAQLTSYFWICGWLGLERNCKHSYSYIWLDIFSKETEKATSFQQMLIFCFNFQYRWSYMRRHCRTSLWPSWRATHLNSATNSWTGQLTKHRTCWCTVRNFADSTSPHFSILSIIFYKIINEGSLPLHQLTEKTTHPSLGGQRVCVGGGGEEGCFSCWGVKMGRQRIFRLARKFSFECWLLSTIFYCWYITSSIFLSTIAVSALLYLSLPSCYFSTSSWS